MDRKKFEVEKGEALYPELRLLLETAAEIKGAVELQVLAGNVPREFLKPPSDQALILS